MTEERMEEELFEGEFPEVELTDEDGNVMKFREEMVIPYDGKHFAILVSVPSEECGEGCSCHQEAEAIIARIEQGAEGGDDEYVSPTDDEFEAVLALYESVEVEE